MNELSSIDLHKPKGVGKERTFSAQVGKVSDLPVGGQEGNKFILTVENPQGNGEPLLLVAKEQFELNDKQIEELCKTYRMLYSKGYPVPPTVRYYKNENRNYLAMSDMTDGGKSWVWGPNDEPSPYEEEQLSEMNLSDDEVKEVEAKVTELTHKALEDRLNLDAYVLAVRKNKETGKIDVIILDVAASYLFKEFLVDEHVPKQTGIFMKELRIGLQNMANSKQEKL